MFGKISLRDKCRNARASAQSRDVAIAHTVAGTLWQGADKLWAQHVHPTKHVFPVGQHIAHSATFVHIDGAPLARIGHLAHNHRRQRARVAMVCDDSRHIEVNGDFSVMDHEIFAPEVESIGQALERPTGAKDLWFFRIDHVTAEFGPKPLWQVVHVESHRFDSSPAQIGQAIAGERFIAQGQQRFGQLIRERCQPRSQASAEESAFHDSNPFYQESRFGCRDSGVMMAAVWRAFFAAIVVVASAQGQALVTPRVGGMTLSGPAESNVTSIFWNPAAMGPLRGFRAYFGGQLRFDQGTVERAAIDTATGQPATAATPAAQTQAFPKADTLDVAPDLFTGVTWDLQSKRVVAGLAVYAPYVEHLSESATWPGHYYRTSLDWYHLYATPAVSFRIRDDLFLGLSLSFVWSFLSLGFDRDTALEKESNSGSTFESADLSESLAVNVSSGPDFTFGIGWLWRPTKRFDFGIVWLRPPLGESRAGEVRAEGDATAGGPVHPEGQLVGRATAVWRLPDQVIMGVSARPYARWQYGIFGRWSNWSVHQDLKLRLSSRPFAEADPAVPPSITFSRGFHDTFALQGSVGYSLTEALRVFSSVLLESAALAETSVNPAAVDGPKLDAVLGAELKITPNISLHAGYAALIMRNRELGASDFDPQAAVACVESGYDVDNPGCGLLAEGRALPTAQATYKRIVHRIGIGLTFAYDPRHR